jgi:hypothetical protein
MDELMQALTTVVLTEDGNGALDHPLTIRAHFANELLTLTTECELAGEWGRLDENLRTWEQAAAC